jgi:hypothetical protein
MGDFLELKDSSTALLSARWFVEALPGLPLALEGG